MKKLVLTLTLAALSTSAFAAEPAPISAMTQVCSQIANTARITMEARQNGSPMREVMELTTNPTILDIITEAYGHPAYSTSKVQEKAIQEFENRWYLKCVKAYNQ